MRTTHETCSDSNYSSFMKDSNRKNLSGYSPFHNFTENLYNKCQSKFSEFATNNKNDLKLMINSQTKEKISIKDFFENTNNDINKLTPIPFISKRKIKNEGEKKELKNLERNVVLMRRLEYSNKIKENNLKKKYNNKIGYIIFIQKMARGYLVRKVIYQVGVINESLKKFFFIIKLYVQKKYFYIFRYNISQIWVKNDIEKEAQNKNNKIKINNNFYRDDDYDENNDKTLDIGKDNNYSINENEINDNNKNIDLDENNFININLENENEINNQITKKSMQFINEQLNKIKSENSNINNNKINENDNFIDISGKTSEKNELKINNNTFENYINASSSQTLKKFNKFSDKVRGINVYKAKVIFIQRYFRKFLYKKEFYGKLGAVKVGFIFIKNLFINKIQENIFNIFKILYKKSKIDVTQEEDFIQIDSERMEEIQKKYNDVCQYINNK